MRSKPASSASKSQKAKAGAKGGKATAAARKTSRTSAPRSTSTPRTAVAKTSSRPKARTTSGGGSKKPSGSSNRQSGGQQKGIVATIVESVTGVFASSSENGTNAIDLLKADHDTVEELFTRVKANEDGDNSNVFMRIKQELDTHAHIEEMIFYPYCLEKGDADLQKLVREGLEEHKQVKLFLAEMNSESGRDPAFKAKMQVLIEDVEHHVEEEEGEMFPMVEDQIEEETLQRLGARMQAEKERFMSQLSRAASAQ